MLWGSSTPPPPTLKRFVSPPHDEVTRGHTALKEEKTMSTSTAAKAKPQAKIEAGTVNGVPTVEVVVPHGTTFAQVAAMHDTISRQAISKISPRGCAQCTS